MKEDNLRKEPKFIVFLSQLMLLFQTCHSYHTANPLIETWQMGTRINISTSCHNAKCQQKEHVWKSQPNMPGTTIPAGNILLCWAILLAGGSATKVLRLFRHMGLASISIGTFFKHQRVSALPTQGISTHGLYLAVNAPAYTEVQMPELQPNSKPYAISIADKAVPYCSAALETVPEKVVG